MDPVSIIGLTSAILQFIDCASKFASTAKRLYELQPGDPFEFNDVEAFSTKLESISVRLSSGNVKPPQSKDEQLNHQGHGEKDDEHLCSLAKQCIGMSKEIIGLIESCR